MQSNPTLIRPSESHDIAAITAIYAWHVEHGSGSFEIDVPSAAEMARRHRAVLDGGLPWLVAEVDGRIAGYAFASQFRPRRAYRFCVEDSIYLAADAQRRGLGRMLLAELIARCEERGARRMLALIGDSSNQASIHLHRASGFQPAGVLRAVGWKFDRWIDVVILQRDLGVGASVAPFNLESAMDRPLRRTTPDGR